MPKIIQNEFTKSSKRDGVFSTIVEIFDWIIAGTVYVVTMVAAVLIWATVIIAFWKIVLG